MTGRILWRAALVLLALAAPAQAGPVFLAALAGGASFGSAFAATALGGFLTTTVGRLLVSVAVSALTRATAPKARDPGLQTRVTLSGGTNPQTIIFGRYATAGVAACPPMSHGSSNNKLTYVLALSAMPIHALSRVVVDGEYHTLGGTADADGFLPFTGRLAGKARIKIKDGRQTTADAWLLATYGSYPERPWTSDMIGRGTAYAIVEFTYDREAFQGLPDVRFEIDGARLYDPRYDTSVGGSGAQRWADPTTWAFTLNPAVMMYNIRRGITLEDGSVWGGVSGVTLPLSSWFAAMNECDVAISLTGGGTEPQFRAGFEASVGEEPAGVFEELLKSCNGGVAESGGVCRIRVGPPGLPVHVITDDDVIVTRAQELDPFPGLDGTYNGIQAAHPSPDALWEGTDAPPLYDVDLEVLDGDRRLIADLSLPAVPYGGQVQRIMRAALKDHRRMRRHVLSLPPEAAILEPLDTVTWSSTRNGYSAKLFEVGQSTDEALTVIQTDALREVDPADYDWVPGYAVPVTAPSVNVSMPPSMTVAGWSVTGGSVSDGLVPRRPALVFGWDATSLSGARGLSWELRPVGGATILRGDVQDVAAGSLTLAEGIISGVAYEARARPLTDAAAVWTSWLSATPSTVLLAPTDLAEALNALDGSPYISRLSAPVHSQFKVSVGTRHYSPDWLVMVAAGQSNALGNQYATTGGKTGAGEVWAWDGTAIVPAVLGTAPFRTDAGTPNNAAFHAAHEVSVRTGRPVLLILHAVPGTAIGTWLPPYAGNGNVAGTNWTGLNAKIAAGLAAANAIIWGKSTIDLLIWQQGEDEYDLIPAYTLSSDRYPALIDGVRAATWCTGTTRMIVGECLPESSGGTAFNVNKEWRSLVTAGEHPEVSLVSGLGLTTTGSDTGQIVHYSGASLQEMGSRIAQVYLGVASGVTTNGQDLDATRPMTRVIDEVLHVALAQMHFAASAAVPQTITITGARPCVTTVFEVDGVLTRMTPADPATSAVLVHNAAARAVVNVWYPARPARDEPPGITLNMGAGANTLQGLWVSRDARISGLFIGNQPLLKMKLLAGDLPRDLVTLRIQNCPGVDFSDFIAADMPLGLTLLNLSGCLVPKQVQDAITAENAARGGMITVSGLGRAVGITGGAHFETVTQLSDAISDGFGPITGTLVTVGAAGLDVARPLVRDPAAPAIVGYAPAGWRPAGKHRIVPSDWTGTDAERTQKAVDYAATSGLSVYFDRIYTLAASVTLPPVRLESNDNGGVQRDAAFATGDLFYWRDSGAGGLWTFDRMILDGRRDLQSDPDHLGSLVDFDVASGVPGHSVCFMEMSRCDVRRFSRGKSGVRPFGFRGVTYTENKFRDGGSGFSQCTYNRRVGVLRAFGNEFEDIRSQCLRHAGEGYGVASIIIGNRSYDTGDLFRGAESSHYIIANNHAALTRWNERGVAFFINDGDDDVSFDENLAFTGNVLERCLVGLQTSRLRGISASGNSFSDVIEPVIIRNAVEVHGDFGQIRWTETGMADLKPVVANDMSSFVPIASLVCTGITFTSSGTAAQAAFVNATMRASTALTATTRGIDATGITGTISLPADIEPRMRNLTTNFVDPSGVLVREIHASAPVRIPPGTVALPAIYPAGDANTGIWSPGADLLALSTGGAERLRVNAAGAQVTGLLSGTAVTQSATDTTAGRLLKVADFGIGGAGTPVPGDDLNAWFGGGIYTISSSTANAPGTAGSGLFMAVTRGGSIASSPNQVQTVWRSSGGAALNVRMWQRIISGSAFGPWHEVYNQSSVLGTVANTGSAVTGALGERGTNSNGAYERRFTGWQNCVRTNQTVASVSTADGSFFESADITWTYPAAFDASAIPVVTATANNADVIGFRVISISNTAVTFRLRARASIGSTVTIYAGASGRWSLLT